MSIGTSDDTLDMLAGWDEKKRCLFFIDPIKQIGKPEARILSEWEEKELGSTEGLLNALTFLLETKQRTFSIQWLQELHKAVATPVRRFGLAMILL